MNKHFLYVADPMCSWCWGFSPVIHEIHESFGDKVPIRVMVGGVRPYADKPMTDAEKAYVREHWEHVHEASGQPFDFSFFDRDDFIYATEPACRAIRTARTLDEKKTLTLLERIQRAFYAEGQNTVDENVLADLASEVGFDRAEFFPALASPDAKEETQFDFASARKMGVTGFPTLLAVEGETASLVTAGYQKWENLAAPLKAWVSTRATATTNSTHNFLNDSATPE